GVGTEMHHAGGHHVSMTVERNIRDIAVKAGNQEPPSFRSRRPIQFHYGELLFQEADGADCEVPSRDDAPIRSDGDTQPRPADDPGPVDGLAPEDLARASRQLG